VIAKTIEDKLNQTLENEINILIIHNERIDNRGKRFGVSESTFYKGLKLCKECCKKSISATEKFNNISCFIVCMPVLDSRRQEPYYWRFPRNSVVRVTTAVKKRIKGIFIKQIALEHKQIKRMLN
jgi:hypothetical protein